MNKKEIVRLLFQRKDIRALFESRRFDASTLKRVISEEIMRESEEGGFTDVETVQARKNAAEMEELQVSLNLAQDNLKAFQSDYLKAKERFTQAKVDGDKAAQSSERGEMAQAKTFKKEEQERIDKIEAQIAYLKSLGVTASKTQTPDDDEYVDMAVDAVAQNIKDATDMIDAAENEAELAGISRDVATSNSGELETAQKAVQAAVAKDKEQSNSAPPSEMLEPLEQEETKESYDSQVNQKAEALKDYPDMLEGIITGLKSDTPTESIESFLQSSALIKMYDEAEHVEKILKAIEEKSKAASPEPPAEETPPQPSVSPGWKNAKSAARAKVTEDTTIEQIKASLESADAFKAFWGVKGEVDTKMAQAKGLFDSKYFDQRIEELKAKATDEDKKEEVAEEAANLAATVMGYSEFLNNMMSQQPDFKPPEMDFPQAIPEDEEEFNRSFIQPLVKIQEPPDASVNKDGLKEDQYIELFTTNAAKNDVLKSITEKDLQVFGGWYIMSRQSKSLNEAKEDQLVQIENYGNFNNFWDTTNGPKFVNDEIKKSIKQRFRKKDPKLEATLAGIQTLIDSGKISIPDSITIGEDPNKEQVRLVTKEMAQDVIENTPEVEPDADADLSPLATEEMDAAWTTTLDVFFGKSREKSSFMRQFLLKNQASMLYGMIGVLEQIITGGAGGEERSLSNEKTQVKQREQPAPPPAEAEKEKETSKTDTTSTDTPVDDEETEKTTSVIPESLEEQVINEIFGMFGGKDNEDKEIKFSPKSTSLMRQDLEAMVDLLRSLKTDIGQYKKYSTSSSVDPRFDGSTLKRAMDAKLKVVQQSIAHLTKVIDIEVQSQKDQLKADGAQAGQDSVDLQEASGSDRKVRIAEVEKVYNEMRRQYLKGLKVSLSTNDAEKAKAGAKELKDYVMGQETFMSYFPSNIITSSGGVMTLGAAHESMVAIIAPFIETIRDIVTITKTQKVSESNLQQAIGNLVMISDSIESMFKVPSLIDREFMKKYIEAAKQNPENQPLTDEEPGMMDKARELTGKALDKLKQMFSWMSNETRKLLLKFFGEDSELIDGLSNSDLSEEQQEALVEDIVESKTWYQNLEQDAKSAVDALVKYLINEVGRDSLKQLNYPAVVSEKLNDDERRTISNFAQETQETFGKELSNRTYKFLHAADEDIKVSSMKLMVEETDDLVSYLTTIFKIVDKISKEAAEEMVSPQTATITQGDQDPNVEDGTPNPPGDLDKDNSELEDVDKPEDEEEKDDATDITALKTPITNQWTQFGNQWLKLSDKAHTIIPDLAGELALKFIEEGAESLSPKPSPEVEQDLEEVLGFSMKEKVAKTISKVKKELESTKNERFSGNSPWAFYSGPSSEAGDGVAAGVRGKRSKSIAINTSMSILNANKDKIEKMLKVSKKKDIIELLKQMVLTKGVPALLGNAGIDFQNNLLSNPFMKQYKASKEFQDFSNSLETGHTEENRQPVDLEEALRPIIEKMLNEHYNH
jgi:hypothetical protein